MSDNSDYAPIYVQTEKHDTHLNSVVKGFGNYVEQSAKNTIVSGDSNYVGDNCNNVTILNSSGCIVQHGTIGATIINSSGVIITEDNLLYINNTRVREASFSTGSYVITTDASYQLTLDNDTLETKYTIALGEIFLPVASGHNKKFTIKNTSAVTQRLTIFFTSADYIDDTLTFIDILTYDSLTVQSNGISKYIII